MDNKRSLLQTPHESASGFDLELDEYVERFERERLVRDDVNIQEYSPALGHPRRDAILIELIRVDLECAWDQGCERSLEEYAAAHPVLFASQGAVRLLAQEEMRLRRMAGEDPSWHEYLKRFPCLEGTRYGKSDLPSNDRPAGLQVMPQAGETVKDFELISELGAGAFARVFLAKQTDLANRLVVVKVSAKFPGEAHTLARLQHTHIVPIHSVHQSGRFHVICMPFLGACTLAEYAKHREQSVAPSSIDEFASTLKDRLSQTWKTATVGAVTSDNETKNPSSASSTQFKRSKPGPQSTYEQSVLQLISDLADGLAHAHDRGILHRDIKPANILLADDGRAMLLDFNISSDQSAPIVMDESIGGTLRYMAPEVLLALLVGDAKVDERADIYSLGIVLYELLTGGSPFPSRTGKLQFVIDQMTADRNALSLSGSALPKLSPAVRSILRKSLSADLNRRYRTASEFRDDLRRQLTNLPLLYAPDRSFVEHARKWVKRHPSISSTTGVSILAGCLLLLALMGVLARQSYVRQLEKERKVTTLRDQVASAKAQLSGNLSTDAELKAGLEKCDEVINLIGLDAPTSTANVSDDVVRSLAIEALLQKAHGLRLWARRETDLKRKQELLEASWQALQSCHDLRLTDEARSQWLAQRVALRKMRGQPHEAELNQLEAQVGVTKASSENAYAITVLEALKGNAKSRAADADYWLTRGRFERDLGLLTEAFSSFRLATELASQSSWPRYHMALALMESGRDAEAIVLLNRVIEQTPDVPEAYFNRAIAFLTLHQEREAIADLDHIEESASRLPRLYFIREIAKRNLGDLPGAEKDLQAGLALQPNDALAWNARGEARLRASPADPAGAFADFDMAIRSDSYLRNAYENKAHVLAEIMGKPDEAISALTEAINHFPDYALARSSRAVLLARAGKNKEARADAEQALAQTRTPIICYQAACVFLLTHQKPEDELKAISLLKETMRNEPSLADLMPADQDLKRLKDSDALHGMLEAIKRLR